MRKQVKPITIVGFAGIMGVTAPMTSPASSPEFSRSSQEWERLRDDVLEYEEIADLIHEYNVTVQNNQYAYNAFIKDHGRTKEDVSDAYRTMNWNQVCLESMEWAWSVTFSWNCRQSSCENRQRIIWRTAGFII